MSERPAIYLKLSPYSPPDGGEEWWDIMTPDWHYGLCQGNLRETLTAFAEWFPDLVERDGFAAIAASSKEALDRE